MLIKLSSAFCNKKKEVVKITNVGIACEKIFFYSLIANTYKYGIIGYITLAYNLHMYIIFKKEEDADYDPSDDLNVFMLSFSNANYFNFKKKKKKFFFFFKINKSRNIKFLKKYIFCKIKLFVNNYVSCFGFIKSTSPRLVFLKLYDLDLHDLELLDLWFLDSYLNLDHYLLFPKKLLKLDFKKNLKNNNLLSFKNNFLIDYILANFVLDLDMIDDFYNCDDIVVNFLEKNFLEKNSKQYFFKNRNISNHLFFIKDKLKCNVSLIYNNLDSLINNSYLKELLNNSNYFLFKIKYLKKNLNSTYNIDRIFFIFSFTKDVEFFINFLLKYMDNIYFFDHKKFVAFLLFRIKSNYWHLLEKQGCFGLIIDFKGKLSMAGNSKKKRAVIRFGLTSASSKYLKCNHSNKVLRTFTGVVNISVYLFF